MDCDCLLCKLSGGVKEGIAPAVGAKPIGAKSTRAGKVSR